jgi:hypothetical protein
MTPAGTANCGRKTGEALALTGKDVGTPIIHFGPPHGTAFFMRCPGDGAYLLRVIQPGGRSPGTDGSLLRNTRMVAA